MRYALYALLLALLAARANAQDTGTLGMHLRGEIYCDSWGAAWRVGPALTSRHTTATERVRIAHEFGCSVLDADIRTVPRGVDGPPGLIPYAIFRAELPPTARPLSDIAVRSEPPQIVYFLFLPP